MSPGPAALLLVLVTSTAPPAPAPPAPAPPSPARAPQVPKVSARPPSAVYRQLQKDLARGWNTWDSRNLLSHVRLPEGLSVSLGVQPTGAEPSPAQVRPGPRADDGSYTRLEATSAGVTMVVESGTDGDDLVVLVTAHSRVERRPNLVVEGNILWGRPGAVSRAGMGLEATLPGRTVRMGVTAPLILEGGAPARPARLAVALDGEIGVYTGRPRGVPEIKEVLQRRRADLEAQALRYRDLAEPFRAIQTALAWNVVYDPDHDRVIAPSVRAGNLGPGVDPRLGVGTYFTALMFSLYDRSLAYANAVEISKSITPGGFIPGPATAPGAVPFDGSQPPVGSRVIKEIYRRYRDRWLLEEVYDELVAWNRWWPGHRGNGDLLSWGTETGNTDPAGDTVVPSTRLHRLAKLESGLENAPLYDGVPLRPGTGILELGDVGLTSLYVMDCSALSEIAVVLGKTADARELRERADRYRKALRATWSEERGIFLDRRTDTGEVSPRLSPTHFYPLLAGAPTQVQAERMMKDHYFNPAEFHGEPVLPCLAGNDPALKESDPGRRCIWPPMNFLVYLGMRNYQTRDARADLAQRSAKLLVKTGEGAIPDGGDGHLRWGALLGFISFIEKGFLQPPEKPL